ncbi:hypothetical protein DFAR_3800020 [Desulfarculales bacterium]
MLPPFVQGLEPAVAAASTHHLLACRLLEHKGILVACRAIGMQQSDLPLVVAGDGLLAADEAHLTG